MRSIAIDGRNRDWLPRLVEISEKGPRTLVVVCALHMVGPSGIPTLLRDLGLRVRAGRRYRRVKSPAHWQIFTVIATDGIETVVRTDIRDMPLKRKADEE